MTLPRHTIRTAKLYLGSGYVPDFRIERRGSRAVTANRSVASSDGAFRFEIDPGPADARIGLQDIPP